MKFSIKDFFSKCDQIRRSVRIWPHLLKKSLMKNFIFCGVQETYNLCLGRRIQVNSRSYSRMFSQIKILHIRQKVHQTCHCSVFLRISIFLTNCEKIVGSNSFITSKNWFLGDENQPRHRSNPPEVSL